MKNVLRHLVAGCTVFQLAFAGAAHAQPYPTKPVHILVALGPGSGTDTLTRLLAGKLTEVWGQPVVVENRAGGAGAVAGAALVKAEPDGHTLMTYSDGHAVNAALNASTLPYDTLRDITRVSMLATFPTVLVVAPSLGVNSAKELIDLAKAKPGQLSFGSAGIGGGLHFSGELFKLAANIDAVHIPYKGPAEALGEVVAGRIQYMFAPLGPTLPLIKSRKVIPLAMGSAQRSPLMPELPTLGEDVLPGFAYELWSGLFAPAKTPRPVVEKINHAVERVMALPEMKEQLAKQAFSRRPNSPDEFDRFVRSEVDKLRNVIKVANIHVQ
jgi:tripartite-type tricarboxylate transporter receptor subunit TctC